MGQYFFLIMVMCDIHITVSRYRLVASYFVNLVEIENFIFWWKVEATILLRLRVIHSKIVLYDVGR